MFLGPIYFAVYDGLHNFKPLKDLSYQAWIVGIPRAYKASPASLISLK